MDGGDEVAHGDADAVDSQRSSLLGYLLFLALFVGIWLAWRAVSALAGLV